MSENVMQSQNEYEYLSKAPGVQVIRSNMYKKVDLADMLDIPKLQSWIVDVPVSPENKALSVGFFSMRESEDFEFEYTYLEIKTVVRGHIVIRDDQGQKHRAETGDVLIFTPTTTVIFDKESDGDAVYTAHRVPEPIFMSEEKA